MTKMMHRLLAGAALCAALATSPANAAELLFKWQWDGTSLRAITTQDGIVIQNSNVGTQYTSGYGLWNGQNLTNSFSAAFNFYDVSNALVFTYAPSGTAGSSIFNIPILNAVNGPLTPLAGGTSLTASSTVQNLLTFKAGADNYTLQFQSLVGPVAAVPEPATWAMMLAGFGMIGFSLRRRRKQAVRVSYA